MTKTLLPAGLTVHVDSRRQYRLIVTACNFGNFFDLSRKIDLKYQTLKVLFLLANTTEMLQLLLDYGLDPNSKNLLDVTPLIHILCYGSSKNVYTSI